MNHLQQLIAKIERDYNPEFDLPQGNQPQVTWVDMALLDCIKELSAENAALKARLNELKTRDWYLR